MIKIGLISSVTGEHRPFFDGIEIDKIDWGSERLKGQNKGETMNTIEVLHLLEEMPEPEFQVFFESLPERVKLCCKGGLVDWKRVLPEWYIIRNGGLNA